MFMKQGSRIPFGLLGSEESSDRPGWSRRRWLAVGAMFLLCAGCFAVGFVIAYYSAPSKSHDHPVTACQSHHPQLGQVLSDCLDLLLTNPNASSGVYGIYRSGEYHEVFCDMQTDGGGWTVIQRRQDGSVDFYRTWDQYAAGFGVKTGEFWIGNRLLHNLTSARVYSLRIDLEDFGNETRFASYDEFVVDSEEEGFRLTIGHYTGDAGDSLGHHNGNMFTTKDRDQDGATYRNGTNRNCAVLYDGAWWYDPVCHKSNLNGKYLAGRHESFANGINWYHWSGFHYSLKRTEMKIRPKLGIPS